MNTGDSSPSLSFTLKFNNMWVHCGMCEGGKKKKRVNIISSSDETNRTFIFFFFCGV